MKYDTSKFIERAKQQHGCHLDYSKTVYVSCIEPVTIICPKHGEFQQAPIQHIIGNGCRKCGYESGGKKNSEHMRGNKKKIIKQTETTLWDVL